MNKRKWMAGFSLWLAGAVVIGLGKPGWGMQQNPSTADKVYAAGTKEPASPEPNTSSSDLQSQIRDAQKKQRELEEKKKKTEKDLKMIQGAASDVKQYIRKLDNKLNELTLSMAENQGEIDTIQNRMDELNEELDMVQKKQESQYESTKRRIKYVYENADDNYIQILLDAKSLADLYSRMEYIEKITAYDRQLLENYRRVEKEVSASREEAAIQLNDLTTTRETLKYEQKTVKRLVKQKSEQMKIYEGNLNATQSDVKNYMEQIAGQEDEIEELLERQRQQIAQQEAAQGDGDTQVVETSGDYAWPLPITGRISSYFGYRSAPTAGASTYHKGLDIAAPMGTSILATKGGKVVTATYSVSAGNYIAIYHGNGLYSYYMHCSQLLVSAGNQVKKGQVIGKVGSTGISTGAHLHFGINKNNSYVNPLTYVSQP